jgi:uncharacterized membrane protein YdjX (TVP38/TMEM64 family)
MKASSLWVHKRLIGVLAFVMALLLTVQLTGMREHFNLPYIKDAFLMHPLGGVLLFVGLFSLGNLIQLPGLIFLAAAVLALGRLRGGLVTLVAANVSCAVTFLMFRLMGGDALMQLKSPLARHIFGTLHRRPVASITLLRTLFQTAPSLNVALALSGVKLRHYLLGTFLGLPLPIAAYCVFFDFLASSLHIS